MNECSFGFTDILISDFEKSFLMGKNLLSTSEESTINDGLCITSFETRFVRGVFCAALPCSRSATCLKEFSGDFLKNVVLLPVKF